MIVFTSLLLVIFYVLYIVVRYIRRNRQYNNQTYITNKTVILITGGCLGIGKELIILLISQFQCHIINLDIRKDQFSSLETQCNTNYLTNIYCDLSCKDNDYKKILNNANISIESIDILINNAGIAFNQSFESITKLQLETIIQINLLSPMILCKEIITARTSINKPVHIVTMSSAMGHLVAPRSSDYIGTKWGLFGFHEALRTEYLFSKFVHFTILCPYAVNTGMFPGFKSPIPFALKILDANEFANEVIKSIVLFDKIVFCPFYIEYICIVYRILPCYIKDLIQEYICKIKLSNYS